MKREIYGGNSTCPANTPPVLLPEGYPLLVLYDGKTYSELEGGLEERGLKITYTTRGCVLVVLKDVTVEGPRVFYVSRSL